MTGAGRFNGEGCDEVPALSRVLHSSALFLARCVGFPLRRYGDKKMKATLTQERVQHVLSYDPESGVFVWLNPASPSPAKKGAVAGSHGNHGYLHICVDRQRCLAHRLAWLYVYGEWPDQAIDHINGDRHDNRVQNLRQASATTNGENRRVPGARNTSGYLGVSWCAQTKRWMAQIAVAGKHHNLGRFDSPSEAHAAYVTAKRLLHSGSTL